MGIKRSQTMPVEQMMVGGGVAKYAARGGQYSGPPQQQQYYTPPPQQQQYNIPPPQQQYSTPQQYSPPLSQPQYTAYNPTAHAAPVYGVRRVPEPAWPRESVGALIDAYHDAPEYYDYVDDYAADGYDSGYPPQPQQQEDFSRTHSQPDLRDQYGPYDGIAEMPAEVPHGVYMRQGSVPNGLRVGSPAQTPPAAASAPSLRRPSVHDNPPSEYANPDALPAHPPPVRPGLLQESSAAHPPPVRQYDAEPETSKSAEAAPVTVRELDQLQNAIKMNPSDPKLQLTLAKKMVEAATVLASEGGRADVKTTRKNRENYIFDAHKIVKRLTNSVGLERGLGGREGLLTRCVIEPSVP